MTRDGSQRYARWTRLLAVAVVVATVAGCGGRFMQVSTTLTVPPRDPDAVREIQRMALIDFGSDHHPHIADAITNKLLQRLIKAKSFRLVERQKVRRMIEEQHFGVTDYVDPRTAVQIGNILGADHLLMGSVLAFGVEDEFGSFTDIETVSGGSNRVFVQGRPVEIPQMRQAAVQRQYRVRNASVSLNFRVVDAEDGTVRIADSITRSYVSERAVDGRALPQRDQVVEDLLEQTISEIMSNFDYHTRRVECLLSTRRGMGKGNRFFTNGLLIEAEAFYRQKLASNPTSPDVNYNLGVVCEMRGNLAEAERFYSAAVVGDDNEEVFQSRLRIVRGRLARQGGGGY